MKYEKGIKVYMLDVFTDEIKEYEYQNENYSNEQYWNPDYKPLHRLTLEGKELPLLFDEESFYFTREDAEKALANAVVEIEKIILEKGILQELFEGWLNYKMMDFYTSESVEAKIMRRLIKEKFNEDMK